MVNKKCLICGKEYKAIEPNSKYCSLKCSNDARKINRKIWNKKHPKYITNYMREYRKVKQKVDATA